MRLVFAMSLAIASLTSATPAQAKFSNALDLHKSCSAQQGQTSFVVEYAACLQYISATADTWDQVRINEGKRACVPDGYRDFEVKNMVSSYLAAHPETWHLPVVSVVQDALKNAFPNCRD
jgi:hypothetical protein